MSDDFDKDTASAATLSDPIIQVPVGEAAQRGLCTDCGISRTDDPGRCGKACQFIAPDYPTLEKTVHGRTRHSDPSDEHFFGPFKRMVRAKLKNPSFGAQWTGITTKIAERLLERGAIDAVLTMAPDPDDRWRPVPVLVTKPEAMADVRGMRMGYAPLLALLEPAKEMGFKKLAVIGIPCQIYALRALEKRTRVRAFVCYRHAMFRQYDDGEFSRFFGPVIRRSRQHHLFGISCRLFCRASFQRWTSARYPVFEVTHL